MINKAALFMVLAAPLSAVPVRILPMGDSITTLNASVASYLTADNPDVILLMIGINGISTSSPGQLDTLVTSIFNTKPNVRLIVAQIAPKIPYDANVVAYNTYIRNTLIPKVESSPQLSAWTVCNSAVTGVGYSTSYTDSSAGANPLRNFYRVSVNP